MKFWPNLPSPHPIILPPRTALTAKSDQKNCPRLFFAFFFDFLPFQVAFKILHRKNVEKSAKIEDFGLPKPSQNPPKILPKSMSQKTCKFGELLNNFCNKFNLPKPQKYQFSLRKINIFKVFVKFVFLGFSCIFGPKNLPKTLPKRGPNPSKIDAKNVMFLNIDFLGFWPPFWSLLDLQDGAKLAILASKCRDVAHFLPS